MIYLFVVPKYIGLKITLEERENHPSPISLSNLPFKIAQEEHEY